ncbi:2-dehydropantoate 2-reductase [Pseudohyphozyma bogoriensis]|nr:2-dehydropantoate 2-reductase [Pseudohyphozyma bogoriensis]
MRFHCLGGTGSIGSLFATNLARLPNTKVRLILRRKQAAADLLQASNSTPRLLGDTSDESVPLVSLRVERDGLARRTDGLEVEVTPSPADRDAQGKRGASGRKYTPFDGKSATLPNLVRNDPIDTLFITTKANQTLPAIASLIPRLSSSSTIVLCQNGMGTLEGLLDRYWPDDHSTVSGAGLYGVQSSSGRPSFVCATTTHGAFRKAEGHFVHAGLGDVKFGVVPNRAVLSSLANSRSSDWGANSEYNPLLNPRSLIAPQLSHIPLTPETRTLHTTLSALLQLDDLVPSWLPLPTLQLTQLQKLAVNTSVNALTALLGVQNGALVGSKKAKSIIQSVARECSAVFAAHIAREEGRWTPPPVLPALDETEELYDAEDEEPHTRRRRRSRQPTPPPHPPPPSLPASHLLSEDSLIDYTLRVVFHTSVNLSSTLSDILATVPAPRGPSPLSPSRTEIDFINGYVAALGRRYGIATPVVETLGEMVKLKEEMLRCGAVDRVMVARADDFVKQSARASGFTPPPPPPKVEGKEGKRGSSSPSSSPPPSPSRAPKGHERAQRFEEYREANEDKANKRIAERASASY